MLTMCHVNAAAWSKFLCLVRRTFLFYPAQTLRPKRLPKNKQGRRSGRKESKPLFICNIEVEQDRRARKRRRVGHVLNFGRARSSNLRTDVRAFLPTKHLYKVPAGRNLLKLVEALYVLLQDVLKAATLAGHCRAPQPYWLLGTEQSRSMQCIGSLQAFIVYPGVGYYVAPIMLTYLYFVSMTCIVISQ